MLALAACGCGGATRGRADAARPATAVVPVPSATAPAAGPPAPAAPPSLAAPPPRSDHGSGPEGCFTRDELAARQALAKSDNAATYVEALRRRGLQPVRFVAHRLVDGTGELRGPVVPAHVEEREVEPQRRARVIVMPPTGGCGDLSGAFEFARAGNSVWLVKRHVTTHQIDITVCGCPECTCGQPSYAGCGGARVAATTILGYELPAGSVFAGEREVLYVEDFVHVVRVLPPQPVCTPVPPPP